MPKKPYKAPSSITHHPGVLECIKSDDFFLPVEDGGPRHDVLLRPGWTFAGLHDGDRRSARFRTVKEFLSARPENKNLL